jgi:hypothetical protein
MLLLSKDYLMLVVMAFFIALPFAWYAIDQWLQDFAYKINIDWWVFAAGRIIRYCSLPIWPLDINQSRPHLLIQWIV